MMAKPIRILVMDDDPEIRNVLDRFLSERGYEVETAADGEAGLEALRLNPPDVLLMDLEMPKLNGLEVLRRMKLERIDVPVITISGHPVAEELLGPDSLRLGAENFIHKPFDLEYLETTLVSKLQSLSAE